MNLYNVMVYYEGEGSTNIFIPGVGDTSITNGRPLYLKNASFNVVEALRQFRMMMVTIKINAKQEGAFRIIDLLNTVNNTIINSRPREEKITESDISNVLSSGTSGPIPTIEPLKTEESIDYGKYVLPSGSYEGKTLEEVDKEGKLKAVYNGFKSRNPEVKEAIEKYYESQVNK